MSSVKMVQIVNQTKFEGFLTNLETSADDVAIVANGSTNTPGQFGEGCHIPDCTRGNSWDAHRMTISLDKTTLSVWKEGRRAFYRKDQDVYPGVGRGEFLWEDNGLPVVLSIAPDATPSMANP